MTKVLLLPLVPKGGSMEPPEKPLSHRNFAMKFAPYMYGTLKNHNSAKKKLNVVPFQNGGQITDFISRRFDFGQILKTTFPKKFFNKIWLKEGEYEYIYITEIKF